MKHLLPKTRQWKGCWIWPEKAEANQNIYALFRKDFSLDKPGTITLYMSADTRYRLYINREEKGDGPLRSQAFNMYYDVYHIALDAGQHCLAAEVYYIGSEGKGGSAMGGFLSWRQKI